MYKRVIKSWACTDNSDFEDCKNVSTEHLIRASTFSLKKSKPCWRYKQYTIHKLNFHEVECTPTPLPPPFRITSIIYVYLLRFLIQPNTSSSSENTEWFVPKVSWLTVTWLPILIIVLVVNVQKNCILGHL